MVFADVTRIFLKEIGISRAYPTSVLLLKVMLSMAMFEYVASEVTMVTGSPA